MTPDYDQYGIPIKAKQIQPTEQPQQQSQAGVDDYGIPIKKKITATTQNTSTNTSAPSTLPSNPQLGSQGSNGDVSQRPAEYSLDKSGFKPVINQSIPVSAQDAPEVVGLTPIQDLQKQNTSKPDNVRVIPNAGVFNRQVNAFGEVTNKTITDNAPDQSVVLANEFKQKRKDILNPTVVTTPTPENNFGSIPFNQLQQQNASSTDNTTTKQPIIASAKLPKNETAPPTDEQVFKNKVNDNLDQLNKDTVAKAGQYASTVTTDPVAAGFITKAILGDQVAISQKNQVDKGYDVPQSDLYNTGQAGISSLIAGLDSKYKDDPQNESYLTQKEALQKQSSTLINQFPEYKASQLTKAVAEEFGKLHPDLDNNGAMAQLFMPQIKKEMGLSDADAKAIDFDNYPSTNFITSAIAPIYKGALSLGATGVRLAGTALGADKDFLDSKINQMTSSPTFFNDVSNINSVGSIVDPNKNSTTFLQDIKNPNSGKYNYNFHTISNALANGVGNLAWFVYGAKGMGSLANKGLAAAGEAIAGDAGNVASMVSKEGEGYATVSQDVMDANKVVRSADGAISVNNIPFKLGADATNEVGMAGLMMGQGYDGYYQKANTVISDKPEDEWKRHTFALLNGALDYLGFRVLGNVVKGVPPEAEKSIGDILKDAPSMAEVNKNALQTTIQKVLSKASETTKETAFVGGASTLSEIAKAAVTNVMGTDKASAEENKQLPDQILQSVQALPFSMFLPIAGAKLLSSGGESKLYNENLYNAGLQPETYRGQANKLFDLGAIDQNQLNDRIQVVNTSEKVVNSIPQDVFDNLNHNQRVGYVKSKVRELALKAQAAKVDDGALSKFYSDQIDAEVAKRTDIINGAGKDGVSVIKPLTPEELAQRDKNQTVTIAPNENVPDNGKSNKPAIILPETIKKQQDNTPVENQIGTVKDQVAPFTEEIKQPIYKNVFENGSESDINDALKEVAQQANGSEGEKKGAITAFGENIVKIAQDKFPDDKVAPTKGITDFENSLNSPNENVTSILNEDNSINLQKLKTNADRIESGQSRINRLSPSEEQGRTEGGRRNVEASLIANANEGTGTAKERSEKQTESLTDYAKKEGIWHNEPPKEELDRGSEPTVHQNNDGTVTKVITPYYSETPADFLDRTALHNKIFPQDKLTLEGFGNNAKGEFSFYEKQPYIDSEVNATREEIKADLEKRGFTKDKKDDYKNKDYLLEDMTPDNVLKDKDGNLHYIDTRISLRTKDFADGTRDIGKGEIIDNKLSEPKNTDIQPKEIKPLGGEQTNNNNESHREDIMTMLDTMKDSKFDYRISSDISQKDREKGVADLRNGKDSAAARKIKAFVDDIINKGELPIHRGIGGQIEKFDIPFEHWFGLDAKERDAAEKLDDETTNIINDEGITKNNIDNLKHLFNGFPYTEADYKKIKAHLEGQDEGNGNNQKDVTGSEQNIENKKVEGEQTGQKPIGRFEKAAKERADKLRNADIPSWLINKDPNIRASGVTGESLKNVLADAIEHVGRLLDKGVDIADAIKEGADKIIDHLLSDYPKGSKLKPDFENSVRQGFEKDARGNFQDAINGEKEPPETPDQKESNASGNFSEWSRVNRASLDKVKDQFRKVGIAWDERAENAMKNLQKRGKKGERLYDTAVREMDNFYSKFNKGKTPRFNTDDQVAMHFLKIATEQSMSDLAEDAMSKNAYSNVESIGADILNDQFNRVSAVLGAMRSESGVGLAYGNVEARLSPDYGLKVRQMQMIRANKGEPLSEEQSDFVKTNWQKEQELNKREQEVNNLKLKDEFEKKISDLQADFDKQIKDLKDKKAAEPKTTPQRAKLSDNLRDISKRIRQTNEFDKFIKGDKGDTKAAGVTFDMKEGLAQAIDYVAKAVETGEKVADAVKKAVDKFKQDLDENGINDFKDKINGLITKASLPNREDVLGKIKAIADENKTTSITPEMVGKNLIKDFVDSHIGDFDKKDILGEATKKLQEVLPDVTKEQVTEAYLKKGDFVLPKKSRLDAEIGKEKLALKKIAKEELTADQKQKIKLQEEKANSQKRIEELQGKFDRNEFTNEETSTPVTLNKHDAELINIDRERNKLESSYRKEADKIQANKDHVVQRVADTVRSLWVAVLIGRPKTFAKIAWFMVARPTSEVLSKLSFGKAFGLALPDLASAAKLGGESNSIRSVGKMAAGFFRNMGAEKLQSLYQKGEERYVESKIAYEQYKNTEGHSVSKLASLKRDMDNKMFDSLGNIMYQFIGGSAVKDAFETLVHRTNVIEKQFGKIRDEKFSDGNKLDKFNYVMGFVGRSHSALKTLSGRASFAGGFMARIEAAFERGQSLDSNKLLEIAHDSYLDWERGKYQQSNWISDTWNRVIGSIDKGGLNKEKWKNYDKGAQFFARTEVAITRVPVNIIHEEVAEYLAGAFRAPIMAARAYNEANKQAIAEGYTKKIEVNDGIESGTTKEEFKKRVGEIVRDMDGEQAAKVMRLFRKGGMGLGLYAAALIWGGIHFGIFPHKGQKKVKKDEDLKPDELNPGQVMFGNDKLGEITSAMISHTPALWDTFMGLGLAKGYKDDIDNGRTTGDAAARDITTHLKIIESNIPQTQIISPTQTVQTVAHGFKKNVLDPWGLTDAVDTGGGLAKNSPSRTFLKDKNIDVLTPEKYQVKVEPDKTHPHGRMTDKDYTKFKQLRSSYLDEKIADLKENSDGLSRDELKTKVKEISTQATKSAKKQMVHDGEISDKGTADDASSDTGSGTKFSIRNKDSYK